MKGRAGKLRGLLSQNQSVKKVTQLKRIREKSRRIFAGFGCGKSRKSRGVDLSVLGAFAPRRPPRDVFFAGSGAGNREIRKSRKSVGGGGSAGLGGLRPQKSTTR